MTTARYRRIVLASAWYDLLITAPFARAVMDLAAEPEAAAAPISADTAPMGD